MQKFAISKNMQFCINMQFCKKNMQFCKNAILQKYAILHLKNAILQKKNAILHENMQFCRIICNFAKKKKCNFTTKKKYKNMHFCKNLQFCKNKICNLTKMCKTMQFLSKYGKICDFCSDIQKYAFYQNIQMLA